MWKHELRNACLLRDKTGKTLLSDLLDAAQEFYIGDVNSYYKNIKRIRSNFKQAIKNTPLKLPYPVTIFSGMLNGNKTSIIIGQENDCLYMMIATSMNNKNFFIISVPIKIYLDGRITTTALREEDRELQNELNFFSFDSALLVVCLLTIINAKNVFSDEVEQVAMAARNRKRKKKGQPLLEKYHVLKFCPGKAVKKKANGEGFGVNIGAMPVHLCRGHFKVFTAEKPLFGKWVGIFWWQPQVRGNKKNGVVVKDYELVAA